MIESEPQEPVWRLIYSIEDDYELAHNEWCRIIREMKEAQILSVCNGHAIRRLVDFRIQYERAVRDVAEKGPMLPTVRSGAANGHWNPFWAVIRHCDEHMRALEDSLGISPKQRGKVSKVQKRNTTARASDTYLKKQTVPA